MKERKKNLEDDIPIHMITREEWPKIKENLENFKKQYDEIKKKEDKNGNNTI